MYKFSLQIWQHRIGRISIIILYKLCCIFNFYHRQKQRAAMQENRCIKVCLYLSITISAEVEKNLNQQKNCIH